MKIFLISPVKNASFLTQSKMELYVDFLERSDHQVHWPIRDTKQEDPTGGYNICRTNFQAILEANEIHIWYDETSGGSKFDMGGVFMLSLLAEGMGDKIKVIIANPEEVADVPGKSLFKVMKRIAD